MSKQIGKSRKKFYFIIFLVYISNSHKHLESARNSDTGHEETNAVEVICHGECFRKVQKAQRAVGDFKEGTLLLIRDEKGLNA